MTVFDLLEILDTQGSEFKMDMEVMVATENGLIPIRSVKLEQDTAGKYAAFVPDEPLNANC